eukprot:CAMPEP_0174934416 /NCGR_PEP_ID=MMETSP1355-20121228/49450_1 /TAXON_ID=464990 /ORGANISM="Hemiselmis tepida, Strain CCMP443" /LENGTH=203 /DNA_ID=CAMNT_0016181013 /DNA_START=14 /DNA_END=625 /DNA_ORIENTATION=+
MSMAMTETVPIAPVRIGKGGSPSGGPVAAAPATTVNQGSNGATGGVAVTRAGMEEEDDSLPNKESAMNDMTCLGTFGALIGGFALNVFNQEFGTDALAIAQAFSMFLSVHLCTFGAISSTILYMRLNNLDDAGAKAFVKAWPRMFALPWDALVVGCFCYLCSIVLLGLINAGGANAQVFWPVCFCLAGGMCVSGLLFYLVVVK